MVFILFSFVNVYLRILAFGTKFSALNYAAELPLRHSRVCESEKEPKSQGRRCQIQAEPYSITLWPSQLEKIIENVFLRLFNGKLCTAQSNTDFITQSRTSSAARSPPSRTSTSPSSRGHCRPPSFFVKCLLPSRF